ncbi:MAG: hypothetical protein ACYCPM_05370 [Acidobacteriaceae bacterium]
MIAHHATAYVDEAIAAEDAYGSGVAGRAPPLLQEISAGVSLWKSLEDSDAARRWDLQQIFL